ncbi:MAG: GyrI-like domain-containing protein [Candidatus Aminicenantes bacterium]|nr:GyrI-like domain-containing protein [Candidatus Aminicenantes bacterium]
MKKIIGTLFVFIILFTFVTGQEQKPVQEQKPANNYTIPPVVKEVGGFWYIYVPGQGAYEGIGKAFAIAREEKKKQELTFIGSPFVLYWNHPKVSEQPERYIWAVCIGIDKDAVVKPPLKKAFFEKRMAAVCVHDGPIKDIVQSNDVLDKFIDDNYYITVWPVYEVFNPDGKIEITHPVKKIEI